MMKQAKWYMQLTWSDNCTRVRTVGVVENQLTRHDATFIEAGMEGFNGGSQVNEEVRTCRSLYLNMRSR